MKKPLAWVLVLVLLIGLYATNPTKTEFKEYANEYIKNEVKSAGVTSDSFIDSLLGIISGYIAEKAVDIAVTRDNYYLFSIYKIEGAELNYKFLGIFRKFIPIKDIINVKKINLNFKDPRAIFDQKVQIKEDHYHYIELNLEGLTEINVIAEMTSGPQVDIYFMDKNNFEIWKKRSLLSDEKVSYYPDLSCLDSRKMNKKASLNKGIYYLVTDNTDFGQNIPPMNFEDDISDVKITVLLKEKY